MRYYFSLLSTMFVLVSCNKEDVSSPISACYPGVQVRRSQHVSDAPVLVRASGGLYLGFQLVAGNGVTWSACNLPNEFKRDSLPIYVSGYFLTSPELESKNITPLPFEITQARAR